MTEILSKMKQMRLLGMARAFQHTMQAGKNEKLTCDEHLAQLIDAEWDERYNRRLDYYVRRARFRYKATVEQIEFGDGRADRNQVMHLADCEFVKRKENIIITGSTGIGKSFLATALGHQACSLGHKVLYQHSTKLFGV